jgi:hypothetical protein
MRASNYHAARVDHSDRPEPELEVALRRKRPVGQRFHEAEAAHDPAAVQAHDAHRTLVVSVAFTAVGIVLGTCPPVLDDGLVAEAEGGIDLLRRRRRTELETSEGAQDVSRERVERAPLGFGCHRDHASSKGARSGCADREAQYAASPTAARR